MPGQRADPDTPSTSVIVSRPGTPLMSTTRDGAASRMESNGTRLCPPANTFESGAASAATAPARSVGRT